MPVVNSQEAKDKRTAAALLRVLLIIKGTELNEVERKIKEKLGPGGLGYKVIVKNDADATALDVRDKHLVIISSTVDAERVSAEFKDVAVPVIVSSAALFQGMGMCCRNQEPDDNREPEPYCRDLEPVSGSLGELTRIKILDVDHPMTAGMGDKVVTISKDEMTLDWFKAPSEKNNNLVGIAAVESHEDHLVLFGYRGGLEMAYSNFLAPAKRVGVPLDYTLSDAEQLTDDFWTLFTEAVQWAVGETTVRQFDEVFREEWREIQNRRELQYGDGANNKTNVTGIDGKHAPENLVGLALSGGGIRSATFCLGLLQELSELKLLRIFDYFSTVSGGGYLGGWWSAWLARDQLACHQYELEKEANEPAASEDAAEKQKAEQRKKEKLAEKRCAIFPDHEEIEPERLDYYRFRTSDKIAEGSVSAGRDPIHHLRLFANYLTPRKGALSGDTWRAVAVISRNLLLTWLILLPIVMVAIMFGQLVFVLGRDAGFFNGTTSDVPLGSGYCGLMCHRAMFIGQLLIPFVGWIVVMTVAYMRSGASKPFFVKIKDALFEDNPGRFFGLWLPTGSKPGTNTQREKWYSFAHQAGAIGVALIIIFALALAFQPQPGTGTDWVSYIRNIRKGADGIWVTLWHSDVKSWPLWLDVLIPWLAVTAILILYTLPWSNPKREHGDETMREEWRREVWRNKIIRVHSTLLVLVVIAAVVLVFAGFGHEVLDYLLSARTTELLSSDTLKRIGGWGTFVVAIAGSIFTAFKSAPTGGHGKGEVSEPSVVSNFVIKITPFLVIVVLMITSSWVTHWLLGYTTKIYQGQLLWPLTAIALLGAAISLFYALFEIQWQEESSPVRALLILALIVVGVMIHNSWPLVQRFQAPQELSSSQMFRLLVGVFAIGGGLIFRLTMIERKAGVDRRRFNMWPFKEGETNARLPYVGLFLSCLIFGAIAYGILSLTFRTILPDAPTPRTHLALVTFGGALICLISVLIEMHYGKGNNKRSLIVFVCVYLMLGALLYISFFNNYGTNDQPTTIKLVHAVLGLIATALAWTITLGWMSDPNALSMHAFYRGRLVRAYLGASNPQRTHSNREITESVFGDDILLSELQNCQRGGPYHLLNTTLNLVGGRDLATAQRSSAMFVLSKLYCGSFRTGFRRGTGYMDGRLSLGTAVATSGAAVSPGMGSGKTTASLAMLMTLLNVRLGYWAPTPSKDEWRSPQARLWPFFMMREFLSQTNDLSSYCYLTDGGHFENTGLYSLVERGCRYIVVADCAADPEPCFSDLGNAIRRCRIDFAADIDLDITPFIKTSKDDRFAREHFVVGKITYSLEHVTKLGWKGAEDGDLDNPQTREGVIIYLKPALLESEKDLRADVRQYEIENSNFPQQTTVDQWFDESQFESYRKLGQRSVQSAFGSLSGTEKITSRSDADQPASLKSSEPSPIPDRQVADKIKNGEPLSPSVVKALFDSFNQSHQENGSKNKAIVDEE